MVEKHLKIKNKSIHVYHQVKGPLTWKDRLFSLSFLNVMRKCHLFYDFHVFIGWFFILEGITNKSTIIRLLSITHCKI